jgi:hypothetical protein
VSLGLTSNATDGSVAVITVITTESLAVAGIAHMALLVSITFTRSPLAGTKLYVLPVPTFIPFTLHWYAGVEPPFTTFAVKVTAVPAHTVPPTPVVILTDGTTDGSTVITTLPVMLLLHVVKVLTAITV